MIKPAKLVLENGTVFTGTTFGTEGETIGEVTGYAVGFGGKGLLDKSRVYQWVKSWTEKRGALVIFIVSIILLYITNKGGNSTVIQSTITKKLKNIEINNTPPF